MSGHTPGPWAITEFCGEVAIDAPSEDGSRYRVATVSFSIDELDEQNDANARLIAAAPDLLDALEELDERLRKCFAEPITAAEAYDSFYQELVAAAIAKAEGK